MLIDTATAHRIGHHAEGLDAKGWMMVHPGMAGQVTADFPQMRFDRELHELVKPNPEDGGLAEAREWAAKVLADDPSVVSVSIRQSVQQYEGQCWSQGRHVETITR